jgi:phenylacetate-CoA ligase
MRREREKKMNIRKTLFFAYKGAMGSGFPAIYEDLVRQDHAGVPPDTTKQLLVQLLAHCQRSVPYYAELMKTVGDDFEHDPENYLLKLPILTKRMIRTHFVRLTSLDLDQRKWCYNTSGGSTGEPVKLIQDRDHGDRVNARQQFYSTWAGADIGDATVHVWGSEREILGASMGENMKKWCTNCTLRQKFLNAFCLTPKKMRTFVHILNTQRPKLIIAYVDSIFELARFAQREHMAIRPQAAIITSAGTLTTFMRETIERVFQCKVFDRYGSREVGDIAGECATHNGLHIFPWGCYVEVVDEEGSPLPAEREGSILVTCLSNYAMPLIRYKIGDRGSLSAETHCACGRGGQMLKTIAGRNDDIFRMQDGTQIDGGYFGMLLYSRPWVLKCQVIQKSYTSLLFKIKKAEHGCSSQELADITSKARTLMGEDCQIDFEFVDNILPSPSGKYRYILSEVSA